MLKSSAQSFVTHGAIVLSLALVACQPQNLSQTGAPTPTNNALANTVALNPASRQPAPPAKSYPALTKTDATGSVSITGQTLTLTLQLPALPETTMPQNFTTQLLDLTNVDKLFAQVTDSHGKTYTPNLSDVNGAIDYTAGTVTLTFNDVVPDALLFVEVQAKDGTTDIPQADLATVLKHTTSASPVNTTINFQTTVAAKAMKALLTADRHTRPNHQSQRFKHPHHSHYRCHRYRSRAHLQPKAPQSGQYRFTGHRFTNPTAQHTHCCRLPPKRRCYRQPHRQRAHQRR